MYSAEQVSIIEIHPYKEIPITEKKISITKNDEEIGFLTFNEEDRDCIYINFIEVKDEHKRKGYGTRLLKELEDYAKKNGYKIIRAAVLDNFSFWIKNGYDSGRKGSFDITYPFSKEIKED